MLVGGSWGGLEKEETRERVQLVVQFRSGGCDGQNLHLLYLRDDNAVIFWHDS